jgi:site-specific recombinase XerD
LISPQEKKKLVDACTNLRYKALIDSHYEAGTRIGEILSVQIKHVKIVRFGKGVYYELAVDGKNVYLMPNFILKQMLFRVIKGDNN